MLRDYQQDAIKMVRASTRAGNKKVMVSLPTGGGKTVIFIEQAINAVKKGGTVLVLVRRRQLVFQTARRLLERCIQEGLGGEPSMVGIYMGKCREVRLITVASVDTLVRDHKNLKLAFSSFQLVIVDECHDCTSLGYIDVLSKLKPKYVIGYTATPYRIGRKGHTFWDDVVVPATAAQLRNAGHLVPTKIYCPSKPDLSKVAVVSGDYKQDELAKVMSKSWVYGDLVKHYQRLSTNRPAICFCVTVEHSKAVAEAFQEAGIKAYHVDADTPQKERDEVIRRLKKNSRGDFVLCNVNIFSTGVDIPEVKTLILARPTRSLVLYLQQVGRGLRPAKGKRDCLILDHAGNCLKFGSPYNKFSPQLSDMEKFKRDKVANKFKDCSRCSYLLPLNAKQCPACGAVIKTEREVLLEKDHNLVEFKDEVYTKSELKRKVTNYKHVLEKKLRYPPSWVRHKLERTYGKKLVKEFVQ